jgi:signal transduction histidine kinase
VKLDLSPLGRIWRRLRGVAGVAATTWGMFTGATQPGWHGRHLVVLVLVVVASAGWLLGSFLDRWPRALAGTLVVGALAGVALIGVNPHGIALVYPAAMCAIAAAKLRTEWSLSLAGLVAVAYSGTKLAVHDSLLWLLGGNLAILIAVMAGTIRRQSDERAEQAELLLAETQHAHEEQARSAALAERARIAREIHDVLAHTLTALAVQLETVDALLDRDRVGQARETIARAHTLMREGLAETRRAISALRDDVLPLPHLLRVLADAYTADTAAPSTVEIDGIERIVSAEAGLALYRTAQEAVTNVRKHAPGAAIAMRLRYGPADVGLTVTNTGGSPAVSSAVPSTSYRVGGYGLTGLRERAELAGGSFTADPIDNGWRVGVMIPS